MKKMLACSLIFALILSLGVVAYAAPSPTKIITIEDLPGTTDAVVADSTSASAKIIPNEELNDEQKEAVNKVLEEVTKDGYLPNESFYVEADGEAIIVIVLEEGEVAFVIDANGNMVEYKAEDLTSLGDNKYELTVDGACTVVIAKKA